MTEKAILSIASVQPTVKVWAIELQKQSNPQSARDAHNPVSFH
jgi:hypothetical protein